MFLFTPKCQLLTDDYERPTKHVAAGPELLSKRIIQWVDTQRSRLTLVMDEMLEKKYK